MRKKLEDAQKTNAELESKLLVEVNKNRELTVQLDTFKEQRVEKNSRLISASLMSGEQFTVTVPTCVNVDDIMAAVDGHLQSIGKEWSDFKVLQGDKDISAIEDTTALHGPLTIVADVADEDEEDEEKGDNFLESMWDIYDGQGQPNNAPVGTYQSCYWTDGISICRVKQDDGSWVYRSDSD